MVDDIQLTTDQENQYINLLPFVNPNPYVVQQGTSLGKVSQLYSSCTNYTSRTDCVRSLASGLVVLVPSLLPCYYLLLWAGVFAVPVPGDSSSLRDQTCRKGISCPLSSCAVTARIADHWCDHAQRSASRVCRATSQDEDNRPGRGGYTCSHHIRVHGALRSACSALLAYENFECSHGGALLVNTQYCDLELQIVLFCVIYVLAASSTFQHIEESCTATGGNFECVMNSIIVK